MRKTEKQAGKEGHRYSYEEIAEKINILSGLGKLQDYMTMRTAMALTGRVILPT